MTSKAVCPPPSPSSSLSNPQTPPQKTTLTRTSGSAFSPWTRQQSATTESTSAAACQTLTNQNASFSDQMKPWSLATHAGRLTLNDGPSSSSGSVIKRIASTMNGFKSAVKNLEAGVEFEVEGVGNEKMTLKPIEELGIGTFGNAWLVRMNSSGRHYVYKPDNSPNFSRVKHELYLYGLLKNAQFPVAGYLDLEPFLKNVDFQAIIQIPEKSERDKALLQFVRTHVNHGYHLRQYMHQLFPTYEEAQKLEQKHRDFLYEEVKSMFEYAYKSKLPINLERDKIGIHNYKKTEPSGQITYHSKVFYIGLTSSDEEVDSFQKGAVISVENPFELIRKQCLKTFAPEGSDLYKWLDPAPQELVQ